MRKYSYVVLLAALIITAPAWADITELNLVKHIVGQIDNFTVNSDFTAASGQLQWSDGAWAILHTETGLDYYRVNVSGLWEDLTDLTQPGGPAAASFASGNVNITFYALALPLHEVGSMSLSLKSGYKYNESQTAMDPTELYGSAVMRLDSWVGPNGYDWAEPIGSTTGLTASTSDLDQWDIYNYQSDWNSDNTIVTILADENGIPEPASILLLGLGGLALLRKHKA